MGKKINWNEIGWGLLGLALSDKAAVVGENPLSDKNENQPNPSSSEKWSLDYRLKSTNYLEEPTIIFKFGGSAWRQEHWQPFVIDRIKQLKELHKRYPIILTTGGGKVQELSKDMYDALGITEETYRQSAGRALATQAQTLADLLGNKGIYVEPDGLHYITNGMLRDKIPVVSMIGREYIDFVEIDKNGTKRVVNSIPEDQSDAHTVVIGHYFGQPGAIWGKVTDGIWVVDPNVTSEHGEIYHGLQAELKRLGYDRNVKLPQIKATDILEGKISRMGGDRRSQHLAEDLGLRLYLNPASPVQFLQVININDPHHVQKAFEGYDKGKHYVGSVVTKG